MFVFCLNNSTRRLRAQIKLEQQQAAIFFLKKILNSKNFDFAIIIIFPSREDIDRIKIEKSSLDDQKWFKELKNLEKEH